MHEIQLWNVNVKIRAAWKSGICNFCKDGTWLEKNQSISSGSIDGAVTQTETQQEQKTENKTLCKNTQHILVF